jgi:hypothetical protein
MFWLGAEGDDEQPPAPDGLRHLTDMFRRVSMLEYEVEQLKRAAQPAWKWPGIPDWSYIRIGSPPPVVAYGRAGA